MPKKTGIVFMIVGAVLILSALLLYFHNQTEDNTAAQHAQTALEEIQAIVSTQPEEPDAQVQIMDIQVEYDQEPQELPITQIDGLGYLGYLTINSLSLELPVLSELNDANLKYAPCRQVGSPATDHMVIAGHNYTSHFAKLYTLQPGDFVTFTDLNGQEYPYTVDKLETIDPSQPELILDTQWPLVLYTCTYGAEQRTVVFCSQAQQP